MAGRPRGRPRKVQNVSAQLASVPDVVRPLADNKNIVMFVLTRNFDAPHYKVYLFIVWTAKKKQLLTRFWGAHGSTLQVTTDIFDKETMQSLIDEKAKHGYRLFKPKEYEDDVAIFEAYVEQIETTLKSTAKII